MALARPSKGLCFNCWKQIVWFIIDLMYSMSFCTHQAGSYNANVSLWEGINCSVQDWASSIANALEILVGKIIDMLCKVPYFRPSGKILLRDWVNMNDTGNEIFHFWWDGLVTADLMGENMTECNGIKIRIETLLLVCFLSWLVSWGPLLWFNFNPSMDN